MQTGQIGPNRHNPKLPKYSKNMLRLIIIIIIGCSCSCAQGLSLQETTFTDLPAVARLPHNSMDAAVADIDGDGDIDIVIAVEFYKNIILLNNGKGYFEDGSHLLPNKTSEQNPKPYQYYPYHDSEDVLIEDINQDGLLDILFVTEDDQTNELYIQKTAGKFEDSSPQFPVSNISNAIAKGDFDQDGWVDVVIGNKGQNNYLKNNGGVLVDETSKRLPVIADVTQDIEAGDYDNDGDLDLLIGNEGNNRLLKNNGKGEFADVSDQVFSQGISEETREADFADIDNDGDLDIYFANVMMFTKKAPIQRLLINQDGTYTESSQHHLKFNHTEVGVIDADFFDLDQDGDLDLLLGKMSGFSIYRNDQGFFAEKTEQFIKYPISGLVVDVEVADFNNDGKPDIYLARFNNHDKLLLSQ